MSRTRVPTWLLCGALAAFVLSCQGQPGGEVRPLGGIPSPGASVASGSATIGGTGGTTGGTTTGSGATDDNPLPVKVVSFPAATSTPAPTPKPPAVVETVSISTQSFILNTPRDTNASANPNLQDAGYPTRHQLVATVHFNDGSYTINDVYWSTSAQRLVTVDQSGLVQTLTPRVTGIATITATSKANAAKFATASVTVEDKGVVQVDVF